MTSLRCPLLVTNADFDAINRFDHTLVCLAFPLFTMIMGTYEQLRPLWHELRSQGWEIGWCEMGVMDMYYYTHRPDVNRGRL